jgi:hypothetical protein
MAENEEDIRELSLQRADEKVISIDLTYEYSMLFWCVHRGFDWCMSASITYKPALVTCLFHCHLQENLKT